MTDISYRCSIKASVPHICHAVPDREACRAKERRRFLDRVYRGAAGELVTALLKEERITREARDCLRKLLDERET